MVDTRTKGSGAKAALEQYFEEIEEGQHDPPDDDEDLLELEDALREVAWLRKEVGDLRTQLAIIRGSTEEVTKEASRAWLKVIATAATVLALGAIFSPRHYRARGGYTTLR